MHSSSWRERAQAQTYEVQNHYHHLSLPLGESSLEFQAFGTVRLKTNTTAFGERGGGGKQGMKVRSQKGLLEGD